MDPVIVQPDKKPARWFTVSREISAEGRWVRQAGGRIYGVVTLAIEPIHSKKWRPVEILWQVPAGKLSEEQEKEVLTGVVMALREYALPRQTALSDLPGKQILAPDVCLACCRIRITNAGWHPVDSSSHCYTAAAVIALKECFQECGIIV